LLPPGHAEVKNRLYPADSSAVRSW